LLNQLRNFINSDNNPIDFKAIRVNKNSDDIIEVEDDDNNNQIDDRFENVLVQRPPRGFVWGVGDQAKKKKRRLKK
jgi:hypothetical protein